MVVKLYCLRLKTVACGLLLNGTVAPPIPSRICVLQRHTCGLMLSNFFGICATDEVTCVVYRKSPFRNHFWDLSCRFGVLAELA